MEGDHFIIMTYFCGKSQRCFKQKGDKDSYAELPKNAYEKAKNHGACCKCVKAIKEQEIKNPDIAK